VLQNPEYSQQLVEQAYKSIAERFSWHDLAKQTCGVYLHIAHERSQIIW
jgi:hypothetical protein